MKPDLPPDVLQFIQVYSDMTAQGFKPVGYFFDKKEYSKVQHSLVIPGSLIEELISEPSIQPFVTMARATCKTDDEFRNVMAGILTKTIRDYILSSMLQDDDTGKSEFVDHKKPTFNSDN